MKRLEGDIIKEQQKLRGNLKQFESDLTKKKYSEEKKLSSQLAQMDDVKTAAVKSKFNIFKKRLNEDVVGSVDFKSQDSKTQNKV